MTFGGWLILVLAVVVICAIGYSLDSQDGQSDE
jgi:hypothetical protein